MPLSREADLGPGHIVLDGKWAHSSPSQKWRHSQFSAHVCCGQTGGWTKIPLGTEVDPALPPPQWGTQPPFSAHVCCGPTRGRIKMPQGTS